MSIFIFLIGYNLFMNKENLFISNFSSVSKYIGDDAAVVGEYIYSKDAFFENVHFKKKWLSLYQVAYKSMMVNISDAVAMNAQPLYALLAVAIPSCYSKNDLSELSSGFIDAAKQFNIEIIGGDTISNTKLDITVTIISKSSRVLRRKGLRQNHLFAYTGTLGRSKKALKALFRGATVHNKSKFINIELRNQFISLVTPYLSSGMDISDGLYSDIEKLTSLNKLGITFESNISKEVGCSGEEYEMLITFDKRNRKKVIRRAEQARTPLTIFATSSRNTYKNRCKSHHF